NPEETVSISFEFILTIQQKIVFFFFIFSTRSFGAFFVHFAYRVPRFCVENSPAFQDAPEWGALYKKTLSVRAHRL
uniref:hypothetical protein n=1 Tax=Faecalibacterium sp. TaxID=1971605 RepID=UPI004027371B